GLGKVPQNEKWTLVLDLVDNHQAQTLVKVTVNHKSKTFRLGKNGSAESLLGNTSQANESILELGLMSEDLNEGGNMVTVSVLEGSWIIFDHIKLEGPQRTQLLSHDKVFIRQVSAADYQTTHQDQQYQPLLVDVEHLKQRPELKVLLDGKQIFAAQLDTGRYIYEALMPAVSKSKNSKYKVVVDGKVEQEGVVLRNKQKQQTLAGYVDTKIGTAHSRWMIAPGPWMPFSMVKLSPDNQNMGWQAGYQPTFETVGTFSHIHEWTMAGLGMMPTNGELQTKVGDEFDPDSGYRSRIDKATEEAPLGYYKVYMTDTQIWAEVTATERAGFQRYTFPKDKDGRVMIDLHVQGEYDYELLDFEIKKVNDYRIEGWSHQISPRPTVWSNDADQEYIVHFVIEFDQPIKNVGGWLDNEVVDIDLMQGKNFKEAGVF